MNVPSDQVRLVVDHDACMGAAFCTGLLPEMFSTDRSGVVALVGQPEGETTVDVPTVHHDAVRNAAASCPSEAISVVEIDG